MSKSNPEKALAALIPAPIRAGSFTVQPMTLGMFATLERIGSPLVTGEDAKDTLELIPSLYLLTHDPREIFAGNILDKAMEWANTVGVDAIGKIKAACDRQLKALFDVIPETPADEKKKKGHDGWIASAAYFAAKEFGWSFREILWEIPASAIFLLRRQPGVQADKIFPLSVIEEIDHGGS
ncbi:MAG: hypothetical protein IKO64_03295 [Kiritimatiellae bacterium]|nr:hypothetical protein [Kiritimatiellia bacterium]